MKKLFFILITIFLLTGNVLATGSYIDNGDGTVTDTATGLMWQKSASSNPMDNTSAVLYCQIANDGGFNDWRIPKSDELSAISGESPFPGYYIFDKTVFNAEFAAYWTDTALLKALNEGKSSDMYTICVRESTQPQDNASIDDVLDILDNETNKEEVDIDKISNSAEQLDNLTDKAIENNASKEELENIISSANQVIDKFEQLTDKIKDKENGKKLIKSLGDVASSGLKASFYSSAGAETVKTTVSKIDEITTKTLDKVVETVGDKEKTEVIATVMEGVGTTFKKIVDNIESAKEKGVANTTIVEAVADQLQEETKNILSSADTHIQKIVSTTSSAQLSNVENFSKNTSKVVGSVLKISSKGLKKDVISNAQALANNAFKLVGNSILSGNFGSFSEETSDNISEIVANHPEVLNEILQKVSIDLSSGVTFDNTTLEEKLTNAISNLDSTSKYILLKGLPIVADKSKAIINQGDNVINANELIAEQIKALGLTNITEKTTDLGEIVYKLSNTNGITLMVPEVKIVPTALSDGIYKFPNGKINLVKNGLGLILSPGPASSINLAKSLLDIYKNTYGEPSVQSEIYFISSDGILTFNMQGGQKLSATFGYSLNYKNSLSTGTVSYEFQGNDPTSQSYSLLVKYDDGSFQSLPPMVSELDLFEQELTKYFGNNYNIDRDTGIIDLYGYGQLKADYFVGVPTDNEKSYFNSNKDEIGVAWKVLEHTNPDIMLFQMITENSTQILYYYSN